ncbi:glucosamine-6-phosphate deaminase [Thermanaeromonas toyohensis ToBE]|uniref:Glucosamine-6-phosphate deaminase n=1 Tax=Thermanaeromonas toyohensis ToBE TaxID=698762 RepID=A0A1W1VVN6_9FIRM|nr:glucosamine-6-phosphate deaminase [Thermanaeromonas toyohensis]SMB97445.1 glucosamine-6-phosphate deaminase [Thermanaeromonas toyohensis ToBE]
MHPELIIAEDYQDLSRKAALRVAEQIKKKPTTVLGLATGKTPLGLYRELIRLHQEEGLDFSRVKTFNLDEYYGISSEDKRSFHYYMWENLFKHLNIPRGNIHLPDGGAQDIEEECRRYEEAIREAGGIDLQVLGIGSNGHIGFNEPGTEWGSLTHLAQLTPETIKDNEEEGGEGIPGFALTMGIKTIMRANRILLLAYGESKANIIARALKGPVDKSVPASILQLHPGLVVIVDKEAAKFLGSLT